MDIKEKWSSPDYLDSISRYLHLLSAESKSERKIEGVDLSGIRLDIVNSIEGLTNPSLNKSKIKNSDFSHSFVGVNSGNWSNWENVDFSYSTFDRNLLSKCSISNCTFYKARLIITLDDSEIENCNFKESTFKNASSGMDYGGKRTKFKSCDFGNTVFRNIQFRASKFFDCNFEGGTPPKSSQFEKMEVPGWAFDG